MAYRKGQTFVGKKACDTAFETLNNKLVAAASIAHLDFSKVFVLDTDASDQAIWAFFPRLLMAKSR